MTPLAWSLIANTIVTALAITLATLAWWKAGGYVRQARATVEAYEPLVKRHEQLATEVLHTARRYQNLAKRLYRDAGDTQEFEPLPADEHPTGRHALTDTIPAIKVGSTELMPATGQLDDEPKPNGRPPAYYFDSLGEDTAR